MKNKKLMYFIIAIIVLFLGIWYYQMQIVKLDNSSLATTTQKTVAKKTTTQQTATTKTVTSAEKPNTFSNIFSQQGSHQCTYDQVTSSYVANNVIYIADGKMRGEFRSSAGGANLMVYDGVYLYTWKEGVLTGTRTQLKSISQIAEIIPKDLTNSTILGTTQNNVSWNCHLWIKDSSLLVAPVGVKF